MKRSGDRAAKLPLLVDRLGLGLTGLALLVLTVLLLIPGNGGPGPVPHLDKLYHFIGFFGLVLPYALVRPHHAFAAVVVATVFGGAIELIQPSFGRGAEWGDALANMLGAIAAALAGRAMHPRLARWLVARPD